MPQEEYYDNAKIQIPDNLSSAKSCTYIGLELECLGMGKRDDRLNAFSRTRDGSLTEGGVEYVSIPLAIEDYNHIKNFSLWAKDNKIELDKTCSFHLHINIHPDDVTMRNIRNIWLAYMLTEDFWFSTQPITRQDNRYCKRMIPDYVPQKVMDITKMQQLVGYYYSQNFERRWQAGIEQGKGSSKRYYWVNLHSIFYHGTVEIRLHTPTCNYDKIVSWAESHKALINWCLGKNVKDILTLNENKLQEIVPKEHWKHLVDRIEKFKEENKEYNKKKGIALGLARQERQLTPEQAERLLQGIER